MAAVRSNFGMVSIAGELVAMKPAVVGWRTALIMVARENRMIHDSCGKSIFCCSALARLQELSKV
jgi:hypothetical protein